MYLINACTAKLHTSCHFDGVKGESEMFVYTEFQSLEACLRLRCGPGIGLFFSPFYNLATGENE